MRMHIPSLSLLALVLAGTGHAQTPCPGTDACPGAVAEMVCPAPGTTLPGNDVTFTWCNAGGDYFLDIASVPGAHDIFYALVSAQHFVHLLNLPTNGGAIYVSLWTQVHGQWLTPLQYTYTAAGLHAPRLAAPKLGSDGRFQLTIEGLTAGRTNVVQRSSDLSNWTSISTNVAASNTLQVIDPAAGLSRSLFYRILEML